MTQPVNAGAAALDELIFCRDRWFVIDADNRRVAGVVVPSLEAGLRLVGQGSVATLVGRVREGLLVVDVDVEAERGHAITEQLVTWCEARGLWHLVRPSGGAEGRAHVFIAHEGHEDALRAQVATLRSRWRAAARAVDVRRHVRPLSAPHRRGGCPRPLGALSAAATGLRARLGDCPSPTSPASRTGGTRAAAESGERGWEALAPRPRRAGDLPAEWAAYLRAGICPQVPGEDQSRSAIEAIATGHLLRAGHTASSAWQAIRGAHPRAMSKARASRRRWVLWVWNRAVRQDAEWAAQAPADAGGRGGGSDDQGVAVAVAAAGAVLWELQWAVSGRRRPALLLVGHTVLDRMARTGSLRVPVPERDLVLDTGISDRKVIRACLRLLGGIGAAAAPVGVLHTDAYDPGRKETSSYEFEIPKAPPQPEVRETPPPRFHTPAPGTWATFPRLAHSLWRLLTTHPAHRPGLLLEELASRAGVPTRRGDPLSSSQVRTSRDALQQLASAGLACCDAQGRWSARATVGEAQAERAARAYGELVERVTGERAEFRAATRTEWSAARAAAMKAQKAREKAWWEGLPRTEQCRRRGQYAARFAAKSVQQKHQDKAAWAARRLAAGGNEAQRHDQWLDSLSMDEVVARSTRRAAWFAALPGPLQQAYAGSWRGHRERFGISRATTLATSRLEHADSLPDTRNQRDQTFLNDQRLHDPQPALAIGI